MRGQRLLAQAVRQLRLGQDHLGLADGVAGLAAGAQDRGQGAPQPGLGNRRQRLGQGVMGEPGGLIQPAGRGQGLGGGHRAGQRAGVGGGCQLQRAQRQVGGGLRSRTQCLHRRGVKIGQRRWVVRMRGLQQVTGGERCGFAAAEQDLAVLAMQRLPRWPGDHLADSAAQQFVPERERVVGGGHDPGVHRLLDRGQQPGRRFAEHLRRVLQPERRAEHRRGHQQVPGLLAEAIKPPLCDPVHPLRQPGGNQDGAAAGDPDGFIVAQAADQLGKQRRVPGGTTGQVHQGLVGRCAERLNKHCRYRILIQRGQGDPGGTILLQEAKEVFGVMLRCAGPGQKPGDRVAFQVPWQRPQGCQGGRACPLQVIQAHQDRSRRGPLFQMRAHLADPPPGRVRQVTIGITGGEPGEWLTQRRAQREERERPAQLVGCSRRQGKTLPRCHADGLAQQQGLAYPRLSLHQHHTASPLLSSPQQVTDYPLLGLTSAHSLIAGISRPRRSFPACSRRGVTDQRRHAIAFRRA